MKRSERDEWTAALRSGEFMQGKGLLAFSSDGQQWEYCCLGVKCELDVRAGRHGIERRVVRVVEEDGTSEVQFGVADDRFNSIMPTNVILEAWGLPIFHAHELSTMNDGLHVEHRTFVEIADWIEEKVPVEEDSTVDATAS